MRLNRPLLGRGYALNSPFRYSTEQCIEAAKALILNNAEMLTIETSRWWSASSFSSLCFSMASSLTGGMDSRAAAYTGTLASSIVLSMDLFHAIDHDRPEKEMKEVRLCPPRWSLACTAHDCSTLRSLKIAEARHPLQSPRHL